MFVDCSQFRKLDTLNPGYESASVACFFGGYTNATSNPPNSNMLEVTVFDETGRILMLLPECSLGSIRDTLQREKCIFGSHVILCNTLCMIYRGSRAIVTTKFSKCTISPGLSNGGISKDFYSSRVDLSSVLYELKPAILSV